MKLGITVYIDKILHFLRSRELVIADRPVFWKPCNLVDDNYDIRYEF
jgi:hypothetical protein